MYIVGQHKAGMQSRTIFALLREIFCMPMILPRIVSLHFCDQFGKQHPLLTVVDQSINHAVQGESRTELLKTWMKNATILTESPQFLCREGVP